MKFKIYEYIQTRGCSEERFFDDKSYPVENATGFGCFFESLPDALSVKAEFDGQSIRYKIKGREFEFVPLKVYFCIEGPIIVPILFNKEEESKMDFVKRMVIYHYSLNFGYETLRSKDEDSIILEMMESELLKLRERWAFGAYEYAQKNNVLV